MINYIIIIILHASIAYKYYIIISNDDSFNV